MAGENLLLLVCLVVPLWALVSTLTLAVACVVGCGAEWLWKKLRRGQ